MPELPPDEHGYEEAHLVEALGLDTRFGELGATVRIEGQVVIVEGIVPTAERRAAAEQILRELLPNARIENLIVVEELTVPDAEPEVIS
jgi:hypothetical protein